MDNTEKGPFRGGWRYCAQAMVGGEDDKGCRGRAGLGLDAGSIATRPDDHGVFGGA